MKRATTEQQLALLIYGGAAALLTVLWLCVLWQPVRTALPETDLWWMMPTMSYYTDGRTAGELVPFLLSPAPLILGQPVLKMYLWLGLVLFGGLTAPMIFLSLAVHGLNAVLLYAFSRQLAFGRRIAFCAALIYLTFFAHFHAYLWPTAFQHLFAVTTILALLSLYLQTDRLGAGHPHARPWFITTLAVMVFASLQRSTLIAPALMLTHILCCSKDAADRAVRYDRWLPLFALYAVYPIVALTFVGDPIIATAFSRFPLGPALTAGALFLVAAAGLWTIRALVHAHPRQRHRWWLTRALPLGLAAAVWVVLCLRDHRQVLLPYNALLPLVSVLTSLLDPLRKALAVDNVEPYHLIPPQASVVWVLLSVACLFGVWLAARSRHRPLLLLLVWYALTFVRFQEYSFLLRAPSRYFIYLSPVVAILVAWVLIRLVEALCERIRLTPAAGDWMAAGVVVFLCVPNILAIRLALFRGQLANTYNVYDDIRAAYLIRDDLHAREFSHLHPEAIIVQQVLPLPVQEFNSRIPFTPDVHGSFRATLAEVFDDPAMRDVRVNVVPEPSGTSTVYVLNDTRIRTGAGADVDPFTQLLDHGWMRLSEQRHAEALELFERAITTRPFLLRYVLGACATDDVRWITGGTDLRHRIDALAALHIGWAYKAASKYEHTAATMRQEMNDYLFCLVCAAYLESRAGRIERSRYWLSRTRLIDQHAERWLAWMRGLPVVSANTQLVAFLRELTAPGAIGEPAPWRTDDYGFEQFLLRLILPWDMRGGQETLATVRMPFEPLPTKCTPMLPGSPAGGLAG